MKQLNVRGNRTYALVLKPNGREIARMEWPRTLEEIIVLLEATLPRPINTHPRRRLLRFPDARQLAPAE